MSDEIRAEIKAAAKALCHYPSGPSAVNSCCPGIGRCEMHAAITEIARLRDALATARLEGMKDAADLCDELVDHKGGICAIAIRVMIDEEEKRAAIPSSAKEDNRPSEEIIREDRDAWPDHQANDPISAAAKEGKP